MAKVTADYTDYLKQTFEALADPGCPLLSPGDDGRPHLPPLRRAPTRRTGGQPARAPDAGARHVHDLGLRRGRTRDVSHPRCLAPGEGREPRFGCNRYDWYARSLRPVQAELPL